MFVLAAWLNSCGCALLKDRPVGEVLQRQEPDTGRSYTLYQPSYYTDAHDWPLVVLCYGSPWESADSVVLDWAGLAEDHGLLLLAPQLRSTAAWAPSVDKQRRLQEEDERLTLKAVQHVRASCRVADDKIMLSGSASGGRAALFIGLRHPELFRLVALVRPHFDAQHAMPVKDFLDPYQPVLVLKRMGEIGRDDAASCAGWLREQGQWVQESLTAASPDHYPSMVYRFFRDTMAKHPWIRLQAYETDTPMRVRFVARTSIGDVYKYEWDFGDGHGDVVARPEHTYVEPGMYEVTLTMHPDRATQHRRRIRISVPAGYRSVED